MNLGMNVTPFKTTHTSYASCEIRVRHFSNWATLCIINIFKSPCFNETRKHWNYHANTLYSLLVISNDVMKYVFWSCTGTNVAQDTDCSRLHPVRNVVQCCQVQGARVVFGVERIGGYGFDVPFPVIFQTSSSHVEIYGENMWAETNNRENYTMRNFTSCTLRVICYDD
jgi:hypothetical protein